MTKEEKRDLAVWLKEWEKRRVEQTKTEREEYAARKPKYATWTTQRWFISILSHKYILMLIIPAAQFCFHLFQTPFTSRIPQLDS